MIKLIYDVDLSKSKSEEAWLREQKIFPAVEITYDWSKNKEVARIGIIVSQEQALAVKLRNQIAFQDEYRQR